MSVKGRVVLTPTLLRTKKNVAQNRHFSPVMHGGDRGAEFRSKSAENAKKKSTQNFFWVNFLKMLNGGPGPGQMAGTVLKPKIES